VCVGEKRCAAEAHGRCGFGRARVIADHQHDREHHEQALDHPTDHDRRGRRVHPAPKMVDAVERECGGERDRRRGEPMVRCDRIPVVGHLLLPTNDYYKR
jgi:hypothetical protein